MANNGLINLIKDIERLSAEYGQSEKKDIPVKKRYILEDKSFYIKDVFIKNPIISAPLAGISDNTFRIFSTFFGTALNFSEMISSYGLFYGHEKSKVLARITEYERPCSLQIFGSEPDIMGKAAKIIEDNADIIDINMGCPVPKILKSKSGGYFLKDLRNARDVLKKVLGSVDKPVSVKTRIGWDRPDGSALEIARISQDCGVSSISVHGRTVKQGYSGKAEYNTIKKIKNSVEIPVIASGDIDSPEKARHVLESTGCDGVMIGRALRANHYILKDIYQGLKGLKASDLMTPDIEWLKEYAKLYLKTIVFFKGEDKGIRESRKHLGWVFRGKRGISDMRKKIFEIDSFEQAIRLIDTIN